MSSQKTNRKVAALNCVFDGFNVGTGTLVLQAKFLTDQSKRTTCAGSCSVDPYDSEDEEADPEWVWNQISASKNIGSITPDQIATLYLYVGKSQKRDADIECPKGIFFVSKSEAWGTPIVTYPHIHNILHNTGGCPMTTFKLGRYPNTCF